MEDPGKLISSADEKVRIWLSGSSVLDGLTMLKMLRILLPHQSSQLSDLERDILKAAKGQAKGLS